MYRQWNMKVLITQCRVLADIYTKVTAMPVKLQNTHIFPTMVLQSTASSSQTPAHLFSSLFSVMLCWQPHQKSSMWIQIIHLPYTHTGEPSIITLSQLHSANTWAAQRQSIRDLLSTLSEWPSLFHYDSFSFPRLSLFNWFSLSPSPSSLPHLSSFFPLFFSPFFLSFLC